MRKAWFRARKYGLGWQPVSWQGWLVVILYVAPLVVTFLWVNQSEHSISDLAITFAMYFIALSLLFLSVCYQTGELHLKKRKRKA